MATTNNKAPISAEQVVEVMDEAKKRTGTFGINQIGNTTPNWAQWMFRIYFYAIAFLNLYLGFDTSINPETLQTILKWSSISVIAVHGFSKMWGIDTETIQKEANSSFTPKI